MKGSIRTVDENILSGLFRSRLVKIFASSIPLCLLKSRLLPSKVGYKQKVVRLGHSLHNSERKEDRGTRIFRMHRPRPVAPRSPPRKRFKTSEYGIPEPEPNTLGTKLYNSMRYKKACFFADITLISLDGIRIPATRVILAISSSYFEKMLTSGFIEKNCSEISISVSGKMLGEILEFIYTDDCTLLRVIRSGDYKSGVLCHTIRELMELAFSAEYTCMDRLLWRCHKTIVHLYNSYPHLAPIVVQVMSSHISKWSQELYESALRQCSFCFRMALFRKFERCSVSCGVLHLDNDTAEKVFAFLEKNNRNSYEQVFLALIVWASDGDAMERIVEDTYHRVFIMSRGDKINILERRLHSARKIAGWFDLSWFTSKFLSDVVEASGLTETCDISDAYKKIAIRYGPHYDWE